MSHAAGGERTPGPGPDIETVTLPRRALADAPAGGPGAGATRIEPSDPEAGPQRSAPAEAAPRHAAVEPTAPTAWGVDSPRRPSGGRGTGGVWSDLDLNGAVPPRARPAIGEWGPGGVPSTREKRRQRWVVPVAFAVALLVIGSAWYYFWLMLG